MIHHSAVSYAVNPDQFIANNAYHRELWHFKSSLGYYLGYNYEISKNGSVKQARADGEPTAACWQNGLNNGKCIHICLDGNFEIENPFCFSLCALNDLIDSLRVKYNIPYKNIFFHKQFSKTLCPGKKMSMDFIRNY